MDLIAELASSQRALLAKAEESRQVVRSLSPLLSSRPYKVLCELRKAIMHLQSLDQPSARTRKIAPK
jgi:hypothetical protein